MTDRLDLISYQLLQKDVSLCSVEELQQLSQQYPFFAPIQFILLRKLKEENAPLYPQHLQKISLYHPNPAALELIINIQNYQTVFPEDSLSTLTVSIPETEVSGIENPSLKEDELTYGGAEEMEGANEQSTQLLSDPDLSNTEVIPAVETSSIDIMQDMEEQEVKLSDNQQELEPDEETKGISEIAPIEQKPQFQPIAGSDLTFEPYHTVDYFASQGIRLSQEEVTKDNFGRQLKSFTEWLKTMKRLPATEQMKKLDPRAEEKVENIAAHSLDNSEILTEAMAEVWVKQGKLEKAIEVYNKLSLLNPSKRTYFAAKLENLKKAI